MTEEIYCHAEELGRSEKPQTLMDMAFSVVMSVLMIVWTIWVSDEINACSVKIEVWTLMAVQEPWLLSETHNHPNGSESHLGGAATCIGEPIRDPLSAFLRF